MKTIAVEFTLLELSAVARTLARLAEKDPAPLPSDTLRSAGDAGAKIIAAVQAAGLLPEPAARA